jgi:hypothetical protein
MSVVAYYAKAIIGAIIAGLSVLAGYLVNDTNFGDITAGQWLAVIIALLTALVAIGAVPNGPKPNEGG